MMRLTSIGLALFFSFLIDKRSCEKKDAFIHFLFFAFPSREKVNQTGKKTKLVSLLNCPRMYIWRIGECVECVHYAEAISAICRVRRGTLAKCNCNAGNTWIWISVSRQNQQYLFTLDMHEKFMK